MGAATAGREQGTPPVLPTGTATFLFTDIEGSTQLLQQLGDGYAACLEQHQRILRHEFAAAGGAEIGTEGDSFFVAFPTASGAVAAAASAQRALNGAGWPDAAQVRVRMGLHTGEASRGGDSYVGIDVHRAARIAAVAHGGQVLLSEATRALVEPSLPDDLSLRDLGSRRLKDLSAPERLYQLVIDGLPSDFPPPLTLEGTPNNLPVQLTSFLGREREIAEVAALLEHNRLLTLTGAGGTGKTRLSLQVAARVAERYAGGVYFVALSALNEVDLVATTIARALELPDRGGRGALERILDHLGERRVLLVLDNFEQLTQAAPIVSELLAGAPGLSILTTSRETLHLSGEQEYGVPPLGLPPHEAPGQRRQRDAQALSQYESVALFIERAMAVKAGFTVTNENAPAVAEICVRLDGLPLAIELAAARIRILSPQAILARRGRQLDLLSGGGSDRPARQQTLRGAIAWSYDLLDDRDRRLFAGMSVFVGGGSLEAIEEVCGQPLGDDVLEGLGSLVDKSLLRQMIVGEEPRFSQLRTIREYALERASEAGLGDELRARHAAYFDRLAGQASEVIMGSAKREWLDRLELEHDNLRAALAWAIEGGAGGLALHLCASLWRFWQMRGYLAEGGEWLTRAAALPAEPGREAIRAAATEAGGGLAWWRNELGEARRWYEESLDLRRQLGDPNGIAEALYNLAFTYMYTGGGLEADHRRVRALVGEALALFESVDNRSGIGRAHWALITSSYFGGEGLDEARDHLAIALETFTELDDQFMLAWTLYEQGELALDSARDIPTAVDAIRRALAIFAEAGDVSGYTLLLDAAAQTANAAGRVAEAARLSGAVERLERETGTGLTYPNRANVGFDPQRLREDPAFQADWQAGAAMTSDEAVTFALELLDGI
jgi:predicted ATPase/class 3 adenylate cyclase